MDKINQPLVSVVTPFYNTKDYLEECIKSVLSQTYQNFEYILLNNCSSDGSLEIAEKYSKIDTRIRLVLNDEFLDKVKNYNKAMRLISSQSKFCKIVQADDMIFRDCLSKMVVLAESKDSIGIVSSYFFLGESIWNQGLPFQRNIFSGREICRQQLLGKGFFFGNFTTTLIRSEIVRNRIPFFNENTYHEDTESCYEILNNYELGFVHQILSFTRTDNDSLFKSTYHYNPNLTDYFIALVKYGPIYLEAHEYNRRLSSFKNEYFMFLGRRYLDCRDNKFWEYHKVGLNLVGYKLNNLLLLRYAILNIGFYMFHPISTVRIIIKKFSNIRLENSSN